MAEFFIWSSCFIYIYIYIALLCSTWCDFWRTFSIRLYFNFYSLFRSKSLSFSFLKRSKSVFCYKRSIQVVFCFLFLWGLVFLGNLHLVYIIGQAISIFFPKWFHSTVWISLFLSVLDWLFCQAILCQAFSVGGWWLSGYIFYLRLNVHCCIASHCWYMPRRSYISIGW